MLTKTGFPEYLESIAIGPDIEFMQNHTNMCDIANEFPQEVNLTYLWKQVGTNTDMLAGLREFVKHFLLDGPDLSPETIMFYTKRFKMLPDSIRQQIIDEVDESIIKAENFRYTYILPDVVSYDDIKSRKFDKSKGLNIDLSFLDKLAALMNSCKSSCNYFKAFSDKIGSVADFSRANSIQNAVPVDGDLNAPPPTGIGLNIFNKIPSIIQGNLTRAYTSAKLLCDAAKKQFSDPKAAAQLEKLAKSGVSADAKGIAYTGATKPSVFQDIMSVHSRIAAKNRRRMRDCFRVMDYMHRYNSFDATMNLSQAKNSSFQIQAPYAGNAGNNITYNVNPQGLAAEKSGSGPASHINTIQPVSLRPSVGTARKHDDKPVKYDPSECHKIPKVRLTCYGPLDSERNPDLKSLVGLGNIGVLEDGDVGLGSSIVSLLNNKFGRTLKRGDEFSFNGKLFRWADTGDEKNFSDVANRIDIYTTPLTYGQTKTYIDLHASNGQIYDEVCYHGYRPIKKNAALDKWSDRSDVKQAYNELLKQNAKIDYFPNGDKKSVKLNSGVSYQDILNQLPGYSGVSNI